MGVVFVLCKNTKIATMQNRAMGYITWRFQDLYTEIY